MEVGMGGAMQNTTPVWVNRLTIVLLMLVLAYSIIGIPEFTRAQEADLQTDAVDPLHRFAWIGLFAASLPVAAARWRQALRLLAASWPLLLLYGYFALSIGWALDPGVAFRRWLLTVIQLLLGVVLLSGLRRASSLHVLIAGVCIAGAVADVLSYAVAPGYAMAEDGFVGLQLQKNLTGLLMMYGCLAAGTAYFLVRSRLVRAGIVGSVLLMLALLVLSRSTTSQSVVLMTPGVVAAMLLFARMTRFAAWAVVASGWRCWRVAYSATWPGAGSPERTRMRRSPNGRSPAGRTYGVRGQRDPEAADAGRRLWFVLGDQSGGAAQPEVR